MNLPSVENAQVFSKTVLLRADLDVPLRKDGEISVIDDDTRLKACVFTIQQLLEKGATVILLGHQDRPGGKVVPQASLQPCSVWFAKKFNPQDQVANLKQTQLGELGGWEITDKLFLLENLRFHTGEEANDWEFAQKLASLGQLYVNDAFAVSHRSHASTVGIAKLLPHFAGFQLENEVKILTRVINEPKRPLVVVVGGKKIETKLPLVEKMHHIADYVLVGGKIAQESAQFLKIRHEELSGKKSALLVAGHIPEGTDITGSDADNFIEIINLAETIIWNGAMGMTGLKSEVLPSEKGTQKIANAIAQCKAYKVAGGGDTVEYLEKVHLMDKFDFVSTGGGAMLALLSGEKLPGLEALLQ